MPETTRAAMLMASLALGAAGCVHLVPDEDWPQDYAYSDGIYLELDAEDCQPALAYHEHDFAQDYAYVHGDEFGYAWGLPYASWLVIEVDLRESESEPESDAREPPIPDRRRKHREAMRRRRAEDRDARELRQAERSREKEQDDVFFIETSGKIASFGKQKAVFAHRSFVKITPSASEKLHV